MSRVFEFRVNLLRKLELRKSHWSVDDFQVCLGAFRTHKANFIFVWQSDERFFRRDAVFMKPSLADIARAPIELGIPIGEETVFAIKAVADAS